MTFRTYVDDSFVRPELRFGVRLVPDEDRWAKGHAVARAPKRWAMLVELLEQTERPTIVYGTSRRDCDELAEALSSRLGFECLAYHAGLDDMERQRRELAFSSGAVDLIVATNAFGMGIDKGNIRSVIHWRCPSTPEALYQEAGRAGRSKEGQPAHAVMLFNDADLDSAFHLLRRGAPSAAEVRRCDLALREIADHAGSNVATVSDTDLAALSGLRADVEPRVLVAHLERAGLVAETDRLRGVSSLRLCRVDLPLSTLEQLIVDQLATAMPGTGLIVSDVADAAGVDIRAVHSALACMQRRGIIERSRTVSVALLSDDAVEMIEQTRHAALRVWKDLEVHRREKGTQRFLRGYGRGVGDADAVNEAVELLAAMGMVEVRRSDSRDDLPGLRMAERHDLAALRSALAAAIDLAASLDRSRTDIELRELSARVRHEARAVAGGLQILHLVGAASVDLRTWQEEQTATIRRIRVVDVGDRDARLADAAAAASERAREQRLRIEALRRYAQIERPEDADEDPYQRYLHRYFTEAGFLDDVGRDGAEALLAGLTDDQQRAVTAPADLPLVVLAGPGTGKTRTVVHRVAYRVRLGHVEPERVLAVTFTRAATEEMKSRLAQLGLVGVRVRTMHAVAAAIVGDNWAALGFTCKPEFVDSNERARILTKQLGVEKPKSVSTAIGKAFAIGASPIDPDGLGYMRFLREQNLVDLGEAFAFAACVLGDRSRSRRLLEAVREIVVDEFQDLSPAQVLMVRALTGELADVADRAHLTVVGDPRQTIYEWNGADPSILTDLHTSESTRSIELVHNFRSTSQILTLANGIIAKAAPSLRKVVAARRRRGTLMVGPAADDAAMYLHVATTVEQWIRKGIATDEIAVLAYSGSAVQQAGRALRAAGISSREAGLSKVSSTDVFAAVTQAVGRRGPEPWGDEASIGETLSAFGRELLLDVNEGSETLDDWLRLLYAVDEQVLAGASDLADALRRVQKHDEGPDARGGVTVTTLHKSKGLEWDAVAVTDAGASSFPDRDEERCRLLYVGVTRARRHLDVSWTGRSSRWLDLGPPKSSR